MKRKNCVLCRAVLPKETFLCLFTKLSFLFSSPLNMIMSKVTWTLPFVDRWTQCRHTSFFLPYFFFSKEGKSSTFLWCQNPFFFQTFISRSLILSACLAKTISSQNPLTILKLHLQLYRSPYFTSRLFLRWKLMPKVKTNLFIHIKQLCIFPKSENLFSGYRSSF